ncbi:MAG: sialate O-acetylesterase, partial [Pirellulales bacterium]
MNRRTPLVLTLLAVTVVVLHRPALAESKPLKVFILAGQSNMVGRAQVSTFDHVGMDPKTAPMLKEMRNDDGTPRVLDNVYISVAGHTDVSGKLTVGFGGGRGGSAVGPEF